MPIVSAVARAFYLAVFLFADRALPPYHSAVDRRSDLLVTDDKNICRSFGAPASAVVSCFLITAQTARLRCRWSVSGGALAMLWTCSRD